MKNENTEQVSQRLRSLYESQEDQAELLLASKDVVDRVQKAVDEIFNDNVKFINKESWVVNLE